jgi:hypothetical protein
MISRARVHARAREAMASDGSLYLPCKGEDLVFGAPLVSALENLSDCEIFQIALGHASS